MKTRILHTRVWDDSYFYSLNSNEKLVFLYYLFNERVNIIHCYELPDQVAAAQIGVSIGVLIGCKKKFSEDGRISFYKNYVRLVNAGKYEHYTGEKNQKARKRLLEEMSHDVLYWYNNKKNTPIHRGIDTQPIPPINHKSETIIQKPEEGGVIGEPSPEKKYARLEDVGEPEFQDISSRYQVPLAFVRSKYEDMILWAGEKTGRTRGRNWKLTLMNWVKRDAISRKESHAKAQKLAFIS